MPASAAAAAVIPPPTEPTGPAPDLLLRFEEAAARHPHREAVVAPDGESLDFATLATRVRTLAAALRGAGIRPGQPVGVAIGRGPALLTALLAAWHAGAAYVPLDPAQPQERLHHMVTDAGITVVVADPAAGVIPPPGVRLLDPAATASSGADHRQPWVHVPVGAPAYVIYTSGSTGRPKGVELGEIEAVLSAHPAVAAAVVTVRAVAGSAGHGSSLAAYWVPAPGSGQDPEPLRQHLAASLPDYLTRMSLTPLDALPLAVGGKVDRAALPDPGEQPDSAGAAPAGAGLTGTPLPGEGPEPTGEVEPLIAAAWQEILGRERVLATDDFFDLGGHSLLALRVVANLKKHLGVVIPTRLVYQHPKLRDLALTVADHAGLAPTQDAR
ncbi:AMP-binding protein [Streptomyces sp. HSG2]|uniref:AMP-binding protein n=1 Tax=Streptomyces sp. HSG2 TaxID=2797167 RepID=UPI0019076BA8|nr:AMP-binding protein [Streptomyces sp. HSG2]